MNKTIASIVLLAATSSQALVGPGQGRPQPETKTVCLSVYSDNKDKSLSLGTCDRTPKNEMFQEKIRANGCPAGQAAMTFVVGSVNIKSCPTYTQL